MGVAEQHEDVIGKIQKQLVRRPSPRLYQMPYPSTVHWSPRFGLTKPWAVNHSIKSREFLASFIGKIDHGDERVREKIGGLCMTADRADLQCGRYDGAASILLK